MKLTGTRVEAFLRRPDPAICGVLLYGPDRGLVRERADALAQVAAGHPDDPFRLCDVTMAMLKEDFARLADEMASLSLIGGLRVVRLRDATDAAAGPVGNALQLAPAGSLLIAEGGDLAKRSSLRTLFESAANAATIACYGDDEAGVRRIAEAMLAEAGLRVSEEAGAYLAAHLGGDRAMTRGEIEKLIVYMGAGELSGGPGTVGLDDVVACVGDSREASLDTIVIAAASGDVAALDRALDVAYASGVQPVGILRATGRHLQRLHLAAGLVAAGRTVEQAMAALRPPVFYKLQGPVRSQLRRLSLAALSDSLRLVLDAELACKTAGAPAQAICAQTLWRIARARPEEDDFARE